MDQKIQNATLQSFSPTGRLKKKKTFSYTVNIVGVLGSKNIFLTCNGQ